MGRIRPIQNVTANMVAANTSGPLFFLRCMLLISASEALFRLCFKAGNHLEAVVVDCHFIPSQREQLLVDVG